MKAWILTVKYKNTKQELEQFTCQICEETFSKALFLLCEFAESLGINIGEYYIDAFTPSIEGQIGVRLFKDNNPFHATFQIDKIKLSDDELKELQSKKTNEEFN